jgi:hypothetical protein
VVHQPLMVPISSPSTVRILPGCAGR